MFEILSTSKGNDRIKGEKGGDHLPAAGRREGSEVRSYLPQRRKSDKKERVKKKSPSPRKGKVY